MKELKSRTVLLTGASGGIGPHLASRLHGEGAALVLSGRNREELERLATTLAPARVVVADLTRPDEVERLATAVGAVDILVANAAVPASGELVRNTVSRGRPHRPDGIHPGQTASGAGLGLHRNEVRVARLRPCSRPGAAAHRRRRFRDQPDVRARGMWAETGITPHPLAGQVTPDQVANAVVRAIKENRREIDVAPLGTRLAAAMPRLVAPMARRLGATAFPPAAVERQLAKR